MTDFFFYYFSKYFQKLLLRTKTNVSPGDPLGSWIKAHKKTLTIKLQCIQGGQHPSLSPTPLRQASQGRSGGDLLLPHSIDSDPGKRAASAVTGPWLQSSPRFLETDPQRSLSSETVPVMDTTTSRAYRKFLKKHFQNWQIKNHYHQSSSYLPIGPRPGSLFIH